MISSQSASGGGEHANLNSEVRSSESLRPALFLDRDGTLMEEVNFCRDPRDVRAIPGVVERLRRFREAGWAIVIITNQSGIGRGIISMEQYEAVHAELLRQLEQQIDGAYFCADVPPHLTPRRKPGIGMVEEARRELGLDPARGYFVGDKAMDVECGRNAGHPGLLVHTGHGATHRGIDSDGEFSTLVEALDWIALRELKG